MKTIALIDTNHGRGHHLMYMRWFSRTLLEDGYRVLAFFPVSSEISDWILAECPQYAASFHGIDLPNLERWDLPIIGKLKPKKNPLARYLQQYFLVLGRWQQAADAVQCAARELGFSLDLVFFNWLDNYFSYSFSHFWIDRIFPYPWSGLYFRPGEMRFGKQSRRPHYAIARSSHCQGLTILNEDMMETLRQTLTTPTFLAPDLTDESAPNPDCEIVKRIRIKAGQRKIIGLLGSLSKRKGIMTLLEVAQRSPVEDFFFVFAGTLQPQTFSQDYNQSFPEEYQQVKDYADAPPENCFFYTDFMATEADFNALVNCCDVLFAAYENFKYSSNILTKAAVFQKPVIVSEGFCMAERVQQHQLGVVVPEGNAGACLNALLTLVASDAADCFQFESYRQLHSRARLKQIFQALLGSSQPGAEAAREPMNV
jgi:glycosyltransferase involved in cell wall biosynthesis